MTDRELLELAAKAAGYSVRCVGDGRYGGNVVFYTEPDQLYWNPLTDDGDALRLAVKLGIKVMPYPVFGYEKHSVLASRRWWAPPDDDDNTYIGPEVVEVYGTDPLAATRRAIVRAAAELGKALDGSA